MPLVDALFLVLFVGAFVIFGATLAYGSLVAGGK